MKKLWVFLWFCGSHVMAQKFEIYDASLHLSRYLEETQDLSASFEQRIYHQRGVEKSSGQVQLKKPQQFYWDYRQPSVQKVVSNGKKVYFYDQDLAQVTVYKPQDIAGNLASDVLNSGADLSKKFDVTLEAHPPKALEGNWQGTETFRLKPKKAQEYDSIWLILRDGRLQALWLEGAQKTALLFSDVKRNQGLKDTSFQFKIPKGVDVIGE